MKSFNTFIREMKVKKSTPNPAQARSLFLQAEERLSDLLLLPLSESNASFRFESAYEAIREALQAFLAESGYKPYSHESILVFGKENNLLSETEFQRANRYREIRNDINYRGKKVIIAEARENIEFAKILLLKLREKKTF